MNEIIVKEVKTRRELKKFIDFPVELYKDCPYFTPYVFEDEMDNLTPSKNPASEYCDFKCFLAYKEGKIVGRITAIISRYANEKYNRKRIRFNRIDMIDDINVTKALIKAVEEYGKEMGMTEICGPLGFSDQDKEGLLTRGFDQMNMFATFYTHPYYVDHLKELGFEPDATWKEYRVYIPKEIDPRFTKASQWVQRKFNVHLDNITSKKQLTKEVIVEVLTLTNLCFKDLYGYVAISEDQMMSLAKQYLSLINLRYLQLVRDENNKLVAYGLMIPSPTLALKRHKGHLFPFGFIDFLIQTKKAKVLDMLLVGVDPAYQSSGIISIVFEKAIANAIEDGIEYAETGPELDYNQKVQAMWKSFNAVNHKERVCFVKKIAEE